MEFTNIPKYNPNPKKIAAVWAILAALSVAYAIFTQLSIIEGTIIATEFVVLANFAFNFWNTTKAGTISALFSVAIWSIVYFGLKYLDFVSNQTVCVLLAFFATFFLAVTLFMAKKPSSGDSFKKAFVHKDSQVMLLGVLVLFAVFAMMFFVMFLPEYNIVLKMLSFVIVAVASVANLTFIGKGSDTILAIVGVLVFIISLAVGVWL